MESPPAATPLKPWTAAVVLSAVALLLVTALTVALAALDGLGQPLEEKVVHRLDEVCRLSGAAPGSRISQ